MIIHGDCLDELKKLDKNSVDLIVTDPPYGYSFMGKDWDKVVPKVEIWKECLRVLKDGAFIMVMSAPRQDVLSHMIVNLDKAGFETGFTSLYWTYASGFPKASNMGKMVDKRLGNEREDKEGQKASTMGSNTMDGGKANPDYKHTKGTSKLEGSYGGFQPKPAVEVILVAMKPCTEKTYVDQAMKNGKGITWLDSCRIPYESGINKNATQTTNNLSKVKYFENERRDFKEPIQTYKDGGRFPANLLVSDDVLNDGDNYGHSAGKKRDKTSGVDNNYMGRGAGSGVRIGDWGGYSRFFDLDKWANTLPFLIVPKASKSEKGEHNSHPTVKPLKLMSYLIMLGSRDGDLILDPFCGSGTTLISAKQLSRKFIGIEREKEYVEIAEARLKAVQDTLF